MEKYLGEIIAFIKKNQKTIRKFCLPGFVGIAVIFFWLYGGSTQKIETVNPALEGSTSSGNYSVESSEYNAESNSDIYADSKIGSEKGSSDYANKSGDENGLNGVNNATKNGSGDLIFVDISGSVVNPGVYELISGQRIFHVIELAGGLKDDANINIINQAEEVFDGEKIIIPSVSDKLNKEYHYGETSAGNINTSSSDKSSNNSNSKSDDKIDINTAEKDELETLPGIGESKASAIITYREKNGNFNRIEDIKNVSGIGSNTFENIKDKITV